MDISQISGRKRIAITRVRRTASSRRRTARRTHNGNMPALVADELVRLRSVARDEWCTCGYAEEGSNHKVFAVGREKLKARAELSDFDKDSSLCWDNTGFIVRMAGTTESGEQLVRLDIGRFVSSYVYVDVKAKPTKAEAVGTPVHALSMKALQENLKWQHAVFVVEEAEASGQIRLRSKELPDTYVFVAATETKVDRTGFGAYYLRHNVLAAPRSQLEGAAGGGLWEATAFDVTQEGVEAAKHYDEEAVKDAKMRKVWFKHFIEFCQGCFGIIELFIIMGKECPGIPALRELLVVLGIACVLDPVSSFFILCLTEEEMSAGALEGGVAGHAQFDLVLVEDVLDKLVQPLSLSSALTGLVRHVSDRCVRCSACVVGSLCTCRSACMVTHPSARPT